MRLVLSPDRVPPVYGSTGPQTCDQRQPGAASSCEMLQAAHGVLDEAQDAGQSS